MCRRIPLIFLAETGDTDVLNNGLLDGFRRYVLQFPSPVVHLWTGHILFLKQMNLISANSPVTAVVHRITNAPHLLSENDLKISQIRFFCGAQTAANEVLATLVLGGKPAMVAHLFRSLQERVVEVNDAWVDWGRCEDVLMFLTELVNNPGHRILRRWASFKDWNDTA